MSSESYRDHLNILKDLERVITFCDNTFQNRKVLKNVIWREQKALARKEKLILGNKDSIVHKYLQTHNPMITNLLFTLVLLQNKNLGVKRWINTQKTSRFIYINWAFSFFPILPCFCILFLWFLVVGRYYLGFHQQSMWNFVLIIYDIYVSFILIYFVYIIFPSFMNLADLWSSIIRNKVKIWSNN